MQVQQAGPMQQTFEHIPMEMRLYPQWIGWRYDERMNGKPTKLPLCVRTGLLAAVNRPGDWCTFDEAVRYVNAYPDVVAGIGFVFAESDPFTGIDFDEAMDDATRDQQFKFIREFDSYTEWSPSGKGWHTIIKAKIKGGRRYRGTEIYSDLRFFTMSGNIVDGSPRDIKERQFLAEQLHRQMGERTAGGVVKGDVYVGDLNERENDDAVLAQATTATNGERFSALFRGEWQTQLDSRTNLPYSSQSEADLALINMLAFYTQHRMQITRLFRRSGLGQREKAQRVDYMGYMINKAFDRLPPSVDMDALHNQLQAALANQYQPPAEPLPGAAPLVQQLPGALQEPVPLEQAVQASPYTVPPGMLGRMAQFMYDASPRPVPETALAAALGLMAGICGRAFNINGLGLNCYIILTAATGTGKEAMASGISKVVSQMGEQPQHEHALQPYVGPGDFASGQALIKQLGLQPSFVSVFGEFGLTMKRLSSDRASSSDLMLKKVLLDLFNKSGHGQELQPLVYSDKEKNTFSIKSPAFSMLAETTPETFFNVLDERLIADGLLPRFTIIEYNGPRVPLNPDHVYARLAPDVCAQLKRLCEDVEKTVKGKMIEGNITLPSSLGGKGVVQVTMSPETAQLYRDFEVFVDGMINSADREVLRHLWNRATVKVLKLAALVAVGVDHTQPIVQADHFAWAKNIVVHEIQMLLRKFESGEIGSQVNKYEIAQVREVAQVICEYVKTPFAHVKGQRLNPEMHKRGIFVRGWLLNRVQKRKAFTEDIRTDLSKALDRALGVLIECGAVMQMSENADDVKALFPDHKRGAKPAMFCVDNWDALCAQAKA